VKRETWIAEGTSSETFHVSRLTDRWTTFLSILRECSALAPDVQIIEVLLYQNGFSAAG
jgi:hypothetical protein